MSGPKLSKAEIEENRRRQLELERKNQIMRLVEAQEKYDHALIEIDRTVNELWEYLEKKDYLSWSTETITFIQNRIKQWSEELHANPAPDAVSAEEWETESLKLMQHIRAIRNSAVQEIDNLNEKEMQRKKTGNIAATKVVHTTPRQNGQITEIRKVEFRSRKKKERMISWLDTVLSSVFLNEIKEQKLQQRLQEIKESAVYLKKKIEMKSDPVIDLSIQRDVQDLLDEFAITSEQWRNKQAVFQKYKALCVLTGRKQKEYYEFQDLADIENAVGELEMIYEQQDEMGFIADTINEAMQELGYSCLSSHLLFTDKGEQDCSVYQESGHISSGIVVYTGKNGEVMMRVASLESSRTENQLRLGCDLTEEEKNVSLEQQISFCQEHPDIVKAIGKRGVFLRQKSYLPPTRNNAFKVIVSDNTNKEISRRKRRDGKPKKMSKM